MSPPNKHALLRTILLHVRGFFSLQPQWDDYCFSLSRLIGHDQYKTMSGSAELRYANHMFDFFSNSARRGLGSVLSGCYVTNVFILLFKWEWVKIRSFEGSRGNVPAATLLLIENCVRVLL